MTRSVPFRLFRGRSTFVVVGVLALVVVALGAGVSAASGWHKRPPVVAGSSYLALGDSVSFGYREPANLPTPDYTNATNFTGYPEIVGSALGLRVANAACPGETSASLLRTHAISNGCENSPSSSVGYRTAYPLHVAYTGTQIAYAVHFLRTHPGTRLVSLMIGANDGFICEETTADGCVSELPGVLASVRANVRTILNDVRGRAHYRGQIVIENYYSLDYTSSAQNGFSLALNSSMDTAARPFGVRVADSYGLFQKAAAQAGGDTCKAGLLTTLTTGGCGVHPSVAGQSLLALALEQALAH